MRLGYLCRPGPVLSLLWASLLYMHIMNIVRGLGSAELNAFLIISLGPRRSSVSRYAIILMIAL